MNDEVLDKIQKLLRLADLSRGGTEHEAKMALEKAKALMTRHKIDSAMLRIESAEAIQNHPLAFSRRMNLMDKLLLSLLQTHFGIRVVLTRKVLQTEADLIGASEDVQFAIHAYHFLKETFQQGWNEFRVTGEFPDRSSFIHGLHDGLRDALLEGKRKVEAVYSAEQQAPYQIVLANTKEAVDRFIGEKYGKVRKVASRRRRVYSESYQAGKLKGASIQIHRPID